MNKSIEIIKKLLEDTLKGKFKNFYIGDPYIINESSLPCIIINPVKTDTNILDNQRDIHSHYIDIVLVIDAKTYLNATPDKMTGTLMLMETMEKELVNGSIDTSSILGILRNNIDLGTNRYIENINSIDYTVRKRSEQQLTLEAMLHFQVTYIINRQNDE
jgi:hypothetical protein